MKTTTQVVTFCTLLLAACSSNTGDTGAGDKTLASANKTASSQQSASAGALGDPCEAVDEANPHFTAYGVTEISLASRYAGCESGICLANHFQGRLSCPYGQPADPNDPSQADPAHQDCMTTGPNPVPVAGPVPPQLVNRPPEKAVYCSCRCDGPAGEGPYCACPSGFECAHLVDDYGTGTESTFSGSYCIKAGTGVDDPASLANGPVCNRAIQSCGAP